MSPQPRPPEEGLLVVPRRGQWAMMVSLIFFIDPVGGALEELSGLRLVAGLAGAVAFVVVYWRTMVGGWKIEDRTADDERGAVGRVLALAAIAGGLVAVGGSDWSGTWCFAAAATGLRIERRVAFPALFVLAAAAAGTEALANPDDGAVLSLAIVTIGVGMLTAGFRRLRVVNRQLNAARDEIGRLAVADERLRFARDLHDLLGHSLSVVALKSELASRLIQDRPDQAAEHVRDIEAVSRRALSEVREAVAGYRRPVLSAELAGARSTLAAAGIEVEAAPAPAAELPPDAEAVLAWAIREGATNVLRHSDARRVRISVAVGATDAALELVDDGRGAATAEACDKADDGTGLAGLAERVARVRGRMDAAPHAGGGFRLAVTVPLEAVS
ncbi:MAG TPA: histidine kinase [Baekduia sp.]|nr:histidine kinase [Baekduia sp.]